MSVERFPIVDRQSWLALRELDVTASTAAALFGLHPYITAYKLWALKSGLIGEEAIETPAMRRGRILEPVALQMLGEERPEWRVVPGKVYLRDSASHIGATPDVIADRPDIEGGGVVQIKTVGHFAFKKGWRDGETGEVQVPLWIAIQASVEAALAGASWAAVAAMSLGDGGLEMHIEDVPIKPALMAKLRELVADFWRRVEQNDPYEPDYSRDAALIARLYADDNGAEIDLSGDNRVMEIVAQRETLKARETDGAVAAKERKPLDAELLVKLGNAGRGRLADGRVIEAPTIRRKAYAVEATTFRAIKVRS